MKTRNVREIIRILRADGWFEVRQVGSHKQFRHPEKQGKVTVLVHRGDLDPKTVRSIFRQAQINMEV